MSGSNKTQLLIGSLVTVILILAWSLAYTLGKIDSRPAESPEAIQVSAKAPATSPVKDVPAVTKVDPIEGPTRDWLEGGWAEAKGGCGNDTGDYFASDGRFGAYAEEGNWTLDGDQLSLKITHELPTGPGITMDEENWRELPSPRRHRIRIQRDGANRMTRIVNGERLKLVRCPEARQVFAAAQVER